MRLLVGFEDKAATSMKEKRSEIRSLPAVAARSTRISIARELLEGTPWQSTREGYYDMDYFFLQTPVQRHILLEIVGLGPSTMAPQETLP